MKKQIKNIFYILTRDSAPPKKVMAVLFEDEGSFLKAAREAQEEGVGNLDAITPYPVHGLEQILKIKRSWIPWVTFIFGLIGLLAGLGLTYYTSVVSWPLIIGGKPFFSLPAFIPVIFECTVLFSALASVSALFYACDLPRISPPILDKDLTSHKFALYCPVEKDSEDKVRKVFEKFGMEKILVGSF